MISLDLTKNHQKLEKQVINLFVLEYPLLPKNISLLALDKTQPGSRAETI